MNILTFDVEDWFHLLDFAPTESIESWRHYPSRLERNLDTILSLLSDRSLRATFFCLGWVAETHPTLVRWIVEGGHEVGSHSYAHKLIYRQKREEYEDDLRRSIRVLEDVTGTKVRAYRAPGFSLTPSVAWAFDVLMRQGVEIDCSVFPASRSHGGFKSFGSARPAIISNGSSELKEFPINVVRVLSRNVVFSGGGYFRLLPYAVIAGMLSRSSYTMTYFHPRDFDAGQPVLKGLPLKRRFMSYVRLSSTLGKLERLLDDFAFCDLDAAVRQIDWNRVFRITVSELTARTNLAETRV